MDEDFDSVTLLTRQQVAGLLGIAISTLDDYVKRRVVPTPIQLTPGGRKMWKLATIKALVDKRARSHYSKPAPRGALMQGKRVKRWRSSPRVYGEHE
jgi:predicted DNA-binding transcriptional regulator AlpA